jgi:hypothetical protein
MFDLEEKISEWRKQMLAAGIKSPVPLEELEIHLREEIETQIKSGANAQRAFEVAIQQIGKVNMLKNEFKKASLTRENLEWKLFQIIIAVASTLIPLPSICGILFKTRLELTSGQQISILAAATTLSMLAWSGRLAYRIFPAFRAKRIRIAIACLCFVLFLLWSGFFHIMLPHYDFTKSQLFVTTAWGLFIPAGTVVGLVWGIETAARKKLH